MADRVTIQDIADALGLSRNTVSKAINNTGVLADATKEKVLQKAMELGYKQISYANLANFIKPDPLMADNNGCTEIALLAANYLGASHFSSMMLDKFQSEISMLGYSLSMHRILPDALEELRLPVSFVKERTAGIICFEVFDRDYCKMLCDLGIPVLFVDTPVTAFDLSLNADRLYMDNTSGVGAFVREMARRGKTNIGFIGEHMHCQSFFERYMAFRNSMYLLDLPINEKFCLLGRGKSKEHIPEEYQAYLLDSFQKLNELPDVFICANDFVAIDTLQVFKKLGISVPQDVYLCGFDDSQESKLMSPSLTTIHIHSQIMGFAAVHLLISRIKEPQLNYRTMYTETSLRYRESTED